MKGFCIALFAGTVGCAFVLPFPTAEAGNTTEEVLHSFGSGTDGEFPGAGLIEVKGTLYGTAEGGGGASEGTVFALSPSTGAETVLYSFCPAGNPCTDGAGPEAGLIYVNGILYSTTVGGGGYGYGTVFELHPDTGAENVLYSFCPAGPPCTDGEYPQTGLIDVSGTLYGTTSYGGTIGSGTVFSLDPRKGAEKVLYSFCSHADCTDGYLPMAALIDVNGTLYGTTSGGGNHNGGTVFALDPNTGKEKVAYSFCSRYCTDGESPTAGLTDADGTLYGTTFYGGASHDCQIGCGTAFSLDLKTGVETVVYSFCRKRNCTDGATPYGGLINVNGTLYGTTEAGGRDNAGTVFTLDPNTGKEQVLYSFCRQLNCTDGLEPLASLAHVKSILYGTTYEGGAYCEKGGTGCGTVFSLKH